MKKHLLLLKILFILVCFPVVIQAQFVNKGRDIFVQVDAQMYIKGDISNDTGYILNNGLIVMIDAFLNHSVFESGPDR